MDMAVILHRIDLRIKQLGTNPTEVSRQAGKLRGNDKTTDTIRNWQRRLEAGEKKFGTGHTTLQAVADVLGVTVAWMKGEGPDDPGELSPTDLMRAKAIEAFDGLPPDLQSVAAMQLDALKSLASQAGAEVPAKRATAPRK